VSRLRDWLIAAVVLAFGSGSPSPREERRRIVPPGTKQRRAESVLLLLFLGVMLASLAFIVVYAVDGIGHRTQWLGVALGLAFAFAALACGVIARRLVVTEELAHPYPAAEHPCERKELEQIVEESGSRFTRKKLVLFAGSGALGILGLAALTPALSLGPALDTDELTKTPWRKGRRLVGDDGKPLAAHDIEPGSFSTAYPEGADRELIGSPVVVVRIKSGVVAYSKICTHAGCAIALYRKPTFADVQPGPALVCPCHYSTFDPADNGKVLFGPAGRPLPQLPLQIAPDRTLRAAGALSGPPGPSWWGVRRP
jgi:ubiquinol-cytochrome c reductase iron-sulfur subunit